MNKDLEFIYDSSPQRSPAWFAIRLGRIGSSRLEDWLSVSKAKATLGKPLKARLDYEKELMFELQFGVNFNNYMTDAMQDGVDLEAFAVRQYEAETGRVCQEVGCWYNQFFVASPDRAAGEHGLLEVKVLRDNSFVEVLTSGVPQKHWKQIQGQLWASGREWCDYIALNINTKKFVIIRVYPDPEFHEYLAEAVQEKLVVAKFDESVLHSVQGEIPSWDREPELNQIGGTSTW